MLKSMFMWEKYFGYSKCEERIDLIIRVIKKFSKNRKVYFIDLSGKSKKDWKKYVGIDVKKGRCVHGKYFYSEPEYLDFEIIDIRYLAQSTYFESGSIYLFYADGHSKENRELSVQHIFVNNIQSKFLTVEYLKMGYDGDSICWINPSNLELLDNF